MRSRQCVGYALTQLSRFGRPPFLLAHHQHFLSQPQVIILVSDVEQAQLHVNVSQRQPRRFFDLHNAAEAMQTQIPHQFRPIALFDLSGLFFCQVLFHYGHAQGLTPVGLHEDVIEAGEFLVDCIQPAQFRHFAGIRNQWTPFVQRRELLAQSEQ